MFSVHIIITCRYILEYYTDPHNVDEDATTIPSLGEHWCGVAFAGLHCRHIDWSVDWYTNTVASKKIMHNLLVYNNVMNVLHYNFTWLMHYVDFSGLMDTSQVILIN